MRINLSDISEKYDKIPVVKQFITYINNYRKKYDHKISVFIFFLMLSTIFWFLSSFNKNYIAELQTPVKFENFPRTKILINNLPEYLTLKVEAKGSNLLRKKFKIGVNTVIFDVNSYLLKQVTENNTNDLYILTENAHSKLQDQLENIRIIDINPDTIFFHFDEKSTKTVQIIPNLDIIFEKQYIQRGDILVHPFETRISGPSNIIDTISSIETQFHRFIGLNDSVHKTIPLNIPNSIESEFNETEITIYVEKFTESEISVPIDVENMPDSISLKLLPPSITVKYHVGLSHYDRVTTELFKCTVNYNDISKTGQTVKCNLVKSPSFVKILGYYPKKIEYIIGRLQ